ncbi:50S ribosomal protein L3 [Candidatus Shapirobacteria bacterium]|nr:50S ribosomal protein L3 [Candidatus Shapirobacteria bacterium]
MTVKTTGLKLKTVQKFTQDGHRIPVTAVRVESLAGFKPGDLLKVTGWSKGKGFTGVVKRWGFAGGPKTHGQSDRQRAPGSIGQTTTPGRVFKGKKMAGRSGGAKVTISGLVLMEIEEKEKLLLIKGLLPGNINGQLIVKKDKEFKKFVPLMKVGEKEIKETEEERQERLRKEKEAEEKMKEAEVAKEEKEESAVEMKKEIKPEEAKEEPQKEPSNAES